MKEPVLLKGNSYGLTIVLDPEMEFSQLMQAVEAKFSQAKDFFDQQKQIVVKIEKRKLDNEELKVFLQQIHSASGLNIAYVMEDDRVVESRFKEIAMMGLQQHSKQVITSNSANDKVGQFYKGTLRSGQRLESDESVVVIGDVNPGATVVAKKNVVILGCVKGNIYAGTDGDDNAFIAALDMRPMQIRIGNLIARSADNGMDKKKKRFKRTKKIMPPTEAQLAFVEDGNIYIEPISKALINDITV